MPTVANITWLPPPASLCLGPTEIHVWRLWPGAPDPATTHWLDTRERQRLEAMGDEAGRRQLLATRVGLRRVLGGYVGCHPAELPLRIAEGGKPFLAHGPFFNLTHSGSLALLAVADRAVGIDVEVLRAVPRAIAIARRVLDPAAAKALAGMPESERHRAFLALWTAMEARQKCLGEGVFGRRIAPDEVDALTFHPGPEHLGHLAWAADSGTPRIDWLVQHGP